jgi:exonuclease SbcC
VQELHQHYLLQLQEQFKKQEQLRKQLKTELDALDKRRRAYEENESKKALLEKQGKLLRQHYTLAAQKTQEVKTLGDKQTLEKRLNAYKTAQRDGQVKLQNLQDKATAYFAEWQKQDGLFLLHEQKEKELNESFLESLRENAFTGVDEASALIDKFGDGVRAQKECDEFFQSYHAARLQFEQTDAKKFEHYDENALPLALQEKTRSQENYSACLQTLGGEENKLARLLELKAKYQELEKELIEKQKRRAVCDELRTLLKSNRFLEFIASEYLQEICGDASVKLLELTNGRYFLEYDKEFKVGDNLDAGNLRAVKTLSGGETFLVSLSLALSLSSAICNKSMRPIEFFFLDEGFGTLDGELVDTVMDVLGKLSRDFAVGLISHVEELKHRIDNKILVTGANERHGSKVQVECF